VPEIFVQPAASSSSPCRIAGGGVSAKHPELAQAILQRMYQRQLARQRVEDDLARGEEMSESEEKKKEDEPQTKRAKAWLLLYVCIN